MIFPKRLIKCWCKKYKERRVITDINFKKWDFFKRFYFFYLLSEKGEGRGKEGEREEKYQLAAFCRWQDWGPNPQPRHAPWLGIKPLTFCFAGWCPANQSALVSAEKIASLQRFSCYFNINAYCMKCTYRKELKSYMCTLMNIYKSSHTSPPPRSR